MRVRTAILLGILAFSTCAEAAPGWKKMPLPSPASGNPGFSRVPSAILFTNVLSEERELTNQIYMSGSGVAAGDVDGDGWCDVYLCGIDSPNRLFRNRGEWHFETGEIGRAV